MTIARVLAYLPNGAAQGPLPAPLDLAVGFPLNDLGALAMGYAVEGPRSSLLGQPMELAVEVSYDKGLTWAEPKGARFLYLRDGRDPVKGDAYQVEGAPYILRLSKAVVPFTGLDGNNQRTFTNAKPGKILHDLFTEAQARGAMTGMAWDFTATNDSGGTPWPTNYTISYDPGTDFLAVLLGLADNGLVDFTTNGRTIQVYVASHVNGMGQDRTTGANPVSLRPGRDLTEAPFRRTWEGLADTAYVQGDRTATLVRTNATAVKPWGRQETFVTASGIEDSGTLQVFADASLTLTADQRTEYTHGLDFTRAVHLPFRDYQPGNWVWKATDGATAPERMRVRQITLTMDTEGGYAGNVVLNDRFVEADVRQARRLNGLTNGATPGGTGGTPSPVGNDILAPAAVGTLSPTTETYVSGNVARAQVTLDWADVTTNADGSPITDLASYEVHRRLGTSGAWEWFQSSDQSIASSSGYDPGSQWQFRVRAKDTVNNVGGFSPTVTVNMATDTTAPQVPSQAAARSDRAVVTVTWDGLTSGGQTLTVVSPDLDRVEAHVGTVGFTPTPGAATTLLGSLKGAGSLQTATLTTGQAYDVRFIAIDTSGNASAASLAKTVTVDSPVGAPAAPTATPTPVVEGGIRDLKVSWAWVANDPNTRVEVHLSTTSGFTAIQGNASTLAKTVGGTFTAVDSLPDGSALVPGTNYYVRLIAVNASGSTAPSAEATDTLRPITTPDISSNAAWIGTMDVGRLTAGDFTAEMALVGTIEAAGSNGERVGMSGTEGFYVYGPGGQDLLVSFPTNGTKPNIISGKLTSSTLLVTEGANFRSASEVEPSARLVLGGKINAPKAAPATAPDWAKVTLAAPTFAPVRAVYGFTKGGNGNWFTAVEYETAGRDLSGVLEYTAAGTFVAERVQFAEAATSHLTSYWARGVVYDGTRGVFHVLTGQSALNGYGEDEYYVRTYDTAWNYLGMSARVVKHWVTFYGGGDNGGESEYRPALGWDHTNAKPVVAYHYRASNAVRIDTWNVDATSKKLTAKATTWTSGDTGYQFDLAYVARGAFDLPGDRYLFLAHGKPAFVFRTHATTNGSTRATTEEWPSVSTVGTGGAWWDGSKFRGIGSAGSGIYDYEGGEFYWTAASGDTWQVATTWYDSKVAGTGVHETDLSPRAVVTHTKRARLTVTSDTPPGALGDDQPDNWRLYKGTGTGTPTLYLRATVPYGTNTHVLKPGDTTGAAHAAIPFPNVTDPGRIESATGLSYWSGDDTAKFQKLVVESADGASAAAGNKPALRVGPPTGKHLRVDGDGIYAMSSDAVQTMLNLNPGGATRAAHGGGGTFQVGINGNAMTVFKGGSESLTSDGNGQINWNHGMGTTPSVVVVTSRNNGAQRVFTVTSKTSSQIQCRVETAAGANVTNTSGLSFDWMAFA